MSFGERGSATVEFLVVAVGLLVPLVAVSTTLAQVASAEFAATAIARQGIRALTRSESVSVGLARARGEARLTLSDHGLDTATWDLDLACSVADCLRRGAIDTLSVTVRIPLTFLPSLPGIAVPNSVTVTRWSTERVSIDAVYR